MLEATENLANFKLQINTEVMKIMACHSFDHCCYNYINNTLFQSSSRLQHILDTDDQNLSKGKDHGEDHPNLDQLDVGRAWQ